MVSIPKSIDDLSQQLLEIEEQTESTSEFFTILREQKLTTKEISNIIDVKKYDEITKGFELIQYYLSFEKRMEALSILENIDEVMNETYEDYLSAGYEFVTEDVFLKLKEERIHDDQIDLLYVVTRIISGDNVNIFREDLKYANGWQLQTPIRLFDMKQVALDNVGGRLLGRLDDDKYNKVICKILNREAKGDDLKKVREIPDGYGWPTLGLNQRVWAVIDINTPDDILIDAFKGWLKEARALPIFANNSTPNHIFSDGVIKSNHIKKWYSLRLLAYLDLKILSLFTGANLTMKQYADIVYFDEFDIDATEKVRKTLIPLAKEVMRTGYLNNLLRKVLAEGS